MAMENRWAFDVPIEGSEEKNMTMDALVRAFRFCRDIDPEIANEIAAYAVQSGGASVKFAYSKFLRTAPKLRIPQAERYRKAETMLLELLNLLDVSEKFTAAVALELGELYADCLHRPISALSMYLYANRLGATVEECKLKTLQKKIERMDINLLGRNCADALRLGKELYYAGSTPKLAELFLREAVDRAAEEMSAGRSGAQNLYGQACLALGDFYESRRCNCAEYERIAYRAERDRMYSRAKANGYPEYLAPSEPVF